MTPKQVMMATKNIAIACRALGGKGVLMVHGTTLYSTGSAGAAAPRAQVRWRSMDAEAGGLPLRIEGRSELADDMDSGSVWGVKAVRITAVAFQQLPAATRPPSMVVVPGTERQAARGWLSGQ